MELSKAEQKILALLALGDSPNKEEAQAAVQKAAEMAFKYNIDIDKAKAKRKKYCESKPILFYGETPEIDYLAHIIKDYFFCLTTMKQTEAFDPDTGERVPATIVFLWGEKKNLLIAEHVLICLVHEFKRLWEKNKENTILSPEANDLVSAILLNLEGSFGLDYKPKKLDQRSYYIGLAVELTKRLHRQNEVRISQWGLVPVFNHKEAENALKDRLNGHGLDERESIKIDNEIDKSSLEQGRNHSDEIQIFKGINQ